MGGKWGRQVGSEGETRETPAGGDAVNQSQMGLFIAAASVIAVCVALYRRGRLSEVGLAGVLIGIAAVVAWMLSSP